MWQGAKQAGFYREARTLASRWLFAKLESRSALCCARLLVAIATAGCGRASLGLARADGGSIEARGIADAIADASLDVAADTARNVPAAGAADAVEGVPAADATADRKPAMSSKGEPCTSAGECATGFCAHGVCCTSACTESCKTCAAPSSRGDCAFVPLGVAPPKANDCPASAPSTCGLDVTCDGKGACRSYVAGTECSGRICQDSLSMSVSMCDGAGSCRPGLLIICAPYLCDLSSGTCFSSCTSES